MIIDYDAEELLTLALDSHTYNLHIRGSFKTYAIGVNMYVFVQIEAEVR